MNLLLHACFHNENNQLMNAVQNSTKNTLASTKNSLQLQMFWVAVQRLCSSIYCICIQAPAWFLARIFQILLQTQRSKVQCNCKVWYKLFGAYSMEIYSFWGFPWVCCKLQTFESQLQIHGVHGDNFSQCTLTQNITSIFLYFVALNFQGLAWMCGSVC